jgi:hypothetical protein
MTDFPDLSDERLGQRLAAELPRYSAPAHLRRRLAAEVAPPRRRPLWLAPVFAAAATALILGLFFLPMLPHVEPVDPAQRLVRAVVAEHTRATLWGARRPDLLPASVPWLTQETGIGLSRVFVGDDRLELLGAEPVYLEERRGVAVHYRDISGRHVTYVVLPAPALVTPERRRVTIDPPAPGGRTFRPALFKDSGSSVWFWKQGELACLIVADMTATGDDLARFKEYFVRLRTTTEPVRH